MVQYRERKTLGPFRFALPPLLLVPVWRTLRHGVARRRSTTRSFHSAVASRRSLVARSLRTFALTPSRNPLAVCQ